MLVNIKKSLFLVLLMCAAIYSADVQIDPEPSDKNITTTTSATTNSTSTTLAPKTTTEPITTTPAPITTSTAPTTTVVPITTTAPPKPITPSTDTWVVNGTNTTCIVAQMAVTANITYKKQNNTLGYVQIYLPATNLTSASGSCSNDSQLLTVTWIVATDQNATLTVNFAKNATLNQFMVTSIKLHVPTNNSVFVNSTGDDVDAEYSHNKFVTSLQRSYKCDKAETLNLTTPNNQNVTIAQIVLEHVQLEAFHQTKDAVFSTAENCDAMETPDIVPIVVGCALAGLVVVVLIGYLIGRRRSQARGYLSM